ncbi:GPI ethanolamine phosphate transferase 2 [Anabarilius grahami]|uniref:GPI ethanolamine phosphate transferase 2 n=1 Tax=Anabarilius grahami TaxID=495550 RepID=A0A3N0Y4T9_ANAGA|nr:GPI ethanolamine phosphate transferase 2 [Anabarilius grahami]
MSSYSHLLHADLIIYQNAVSTAGLEEPDVLEQVDLTPTLALALGLPISQNSVGHLIPAVFEELSLREQLRLLQLNGHQLSRLLQDSNPTFHKEDGYELFRVAEKSHGSWMKLYADGNTSEVLSNMGKKVLKQYLEALKAMSSALSKQLGKYDMYSMIMGMIFMLQLNNNKAGESHAAKMRIVSNGVQPYIVQTGVDTDGETQEEVTTFRMKLDVSECLHVCSGYNGREEDSHQQQDPY